MRVISGIHSGAMFKIVTAIIIYLNFELCDVYANDSVIENVTTNWNIGIERSTEVSSETPLPSTNNNLQQWKTTVGNHFFNHTSTTTTTTESTLKSSAPSKPVDVDDKEFPPTNITSTTMSTSSNPMTDSSVAFISNTTHPAGPTPLTTASPPTLSNSTENFELPSTIQPTKDPGCSTQKPLESNEIQKALDWLQEKRVNDAWENDTHMVILAKELANIRDPNENEGTSQIISDLEDQLSKKQMEIDILSMLDKHRSTFPIPVDTNHLARYILALGVLCKDSRRFHSHDLINLLQHHEPQSDDEFALSTLAACSSGNHVRKKQIRRLLDIASGEITNIDTMALVLLALRCIITDHRHRHLQHFIRRPAIGLANLQGPKGSFGSLKSTALAMQALQDLSLDSSTTYDRSAAVKWIMDRQDLDGSWKEEPVKDGQEANYGVDLTANVIIALGCKGLGSIRALQCGHVLGDTNGNGENGENGHDKIVPPVGIPQGGNEEIDQKNLTFFYTLWIESNSNISEISTLQLTVMKNTSFFKAMTLAAESDKNYNFEAREWPNGHYIHTLAGKKEEPTLYHYWLLYRLPESPDTQNPPGNQLIAPVGVDELMVEDGEHYLYWYKKL